MGARVHLCGRLQVEWDGQQLEEALPDRCSAEVEGQARWEAGHSSRASRTLKEG
jgi:hypothetical protein